MANKEDCHGYRRPNAIGESRAAMTAATPRVPMRTKLFYSCGSIALGIKENGFSIFLLIFYNQVVGLPASLVSLAIGSALVIDAFIDPIIGNLSDRTKSCWGRRHPWMYGAALPIALSWLLLWNPPEWGTGALLGYVLLVSILVRSALAAYEVPSIAMLPQITSDYDERTIVLRYRFLLAWFGGLVMLALAFGVILVPSADYPDGTLNPAGYSLFGLVGAVIMFAAIMVSALGTHRDYAKPPARVTQSAEGLHEIIGTLRYRPFLILMIAALCTNGSQGVTFALNTYLFEFVWDFGQSEFLLYIATLAVSAILAFVLIPPLTRNADKPKAAAVAALLAFLIGTAPYWLRLAGVLTDIATWPDYLLLLGLIGLGNAAFIGASVLTSSMIADVTDHSRRETGRSSEGLFFAGFFLVQKAVTGLGIFLAGQILSLVGFPAQAVPGQVGESVLHALVLAYVLLTALLSAGAIASFWRFPLRRADHDDIVQSG